MLPTKFRTKMGSTYGRFCKSFLKAEWKVSDTGSAHWAFSFKFYKWRTIEYPEKTTDICNSLTNLSTRVLALFPNFWSNFNKNSRSNWTLARFWSSSFASFFFSRLKNFLYLEFPLNNSSLLPWNIKY
jgi:hypothetical protein